MRYRAISFRGISPKTDKSLLETNQAQTAENVRLMSGVLMPWFNESNLATLINYGTIRTIFLYEDIYWLEWEADVDLVLGPVAGDTAGKFYYTGHGIPKKSNHTEAITGAGAKPINFYPMGMPIPQNALVAALGGGGSGDPRNIVYVWTVISAWSEQGSPSPASNVVSAMPGQTVNLTGITMIWEAGTAYTVNDWVYPTADEGGTYVYKCVQAGTSAGAEPAPWGTTVDGNTTDNTVIWRCYKDNLSYKRIYRFATGEQFGGYEFVADIAINLTSYADSKLDTELGGLLPDPSDAPPPDNMAGLVYMGNGIILGFAGKDVYASKPYQPWSYPTEYIKSFPATIVAIKVVGETALVTTEQGPFLMTGSDPATLAPIPIPMKVANVAKRGMVAHGTFIAYPGPDGLYVVTGAGIENITAKHYDYKQWQAIFPATFTAAIYENKYWAFYSSGGTYGAIVIDLASGEITTLNFYSDTLYVDAKTGRAHYVKILETEQMPNQVDRDFSGPSAWANVDLNAYNETGDLTITATVVGQYCTLPVASAPTTIGKRYRLTYDVANLVSTWTIKSFDGIQTIGTVAAPGTGQTIEFTATTTGGFRIVAVAANSSGDFDNFSLKDITRYVFKWEGDITQALTGNYTWKSKEFILPANITITSARVIFDSSDRTAFDALVAAYNAALEQNKAIISAFAGGGLLGGLVLGVDIALAADALVTVPSVPSYTGDDNLQLKIYANGVLKQTKEVYSEKPFRLKGAYRAVRLEYAVVGNIVVKEVAIASSMDELKAGQ